MFILCIAQCEVLLVICGMCVRSLIGKRGAVSGHREEGGEGEDLCSGHPDNTHVDMKPCMVLVCA